MNRRDAEKTITEYLKPIYGFALKRCKNLQDAEDLSQEIILRAYRTLLIRNDISDTGKFIWTIAHNALSNYYRDNAKNRACVSLDDDALELIAVPESDFESVENTDSLRHLQNEIAYLSKLQRQIVIAYYYENCRQAEIAKSLGIPVGTVKWHLFEAKKELKRGMDMTRNTSELKFNPIKFHSFGVNGSVGTISPDTFFHSALSQNICYCVRNTAKTVNEIADDLGVSPVYVESEIDFLEQYCFLREEHGRYIANFIISTPTADLLILQDDMYKRAAELFANDLFEDLAASGILDDPDILCKQAHDRHNFLLWSLIPYIAAWSGEKQMDNRISFEEVATLRPDGSHNIFHASVISDRMTLPDDYIYMKDWRGPMWNGYDGQMLWQLGSEWSAPVNMEAQNIPDEHRRVITLYKWEKEGSLHEEDYAWLAERGYIKTTKDGSGHSKSDWQIVILKSKKINRKLLEIGDQIKARHEAAFDELKKPYANAVLDSVPTHLRKVKEYELQFVFHSDGWFLLHCVTTLLRDGKLKPPTTEQKKSLSTLMIS